jgi:hypothetical protein
MLLAKLPPTIGQFRDQGDNFTKYSLTVTKTTKYALRAANPQAANRPARAYLYDPLTAP